MRASRDAEQLAQRQDRAPFDRELARVQALLDERVGGLTSLRVLEAGCGRQPHVQLGRQPHIVGMDISADGLARNTSLAERILGDVQTHPLPVESFDAAVCWDVLEHLETPRRALENIARAVRPGGLIVLAGPNVLSFKGLATKFTPFALHQWTYRRTARSPESKPFRTYLRLATAPQRIVRWAEHSRINLSVEQLSLYESPLQIRLRRRLRLTGPTWTVVRGLARLISIGRLDPAHTDFMLVLRRREPRVNSVRPA